MTPAEFEATYGALASDAAARLGGLTGKVILAQWAVETGWGSSPLCTQGHNLAGIRFYGNVPGSTSMGGFTAYPSLAWFLGDYIATMQLPYYAAVRAATSETEAMAELGASPWDAGHYQESGGAPGSSLVAAYHLLPAPTPAPAPAPAPVEALSVTDRDFLWEQLGKLAQHDGIVLDAAPWATPAPAPAPAPAPVPATRTVTVEASPAQLSTLWGIAQREYGNGNRWPDLYNANRETIEAAAVAHGAADSHGGSLLYAGTVLVVPRWLEARA